MAIILRPLVLLSIEIYEKKVKGQANVDLMSLKPMLQDLQAKLLDVQIAGALIATTGGPGLWQSTFFLLQKDLYQA